MRLILVRHAVTAETGRKLSGRLPDIPLSRKGHAAAAALADALAALDLAAVYTSPIQRCRETAAILAKPHGIKPRPRQGLIEVEYGEWSGRGLKSLYRLRAWRDLMANPSEFRFPNGETLEEVRRRSVRSIELLGSKHAEQTVMAVSHSDTIRSIVAHCIADSVDLIHRLTVSPLGVTVVDVAADHPPRVSIVNAPRL